MSEFLLLRRSRSRANKRSFRYYQGGSFPITKEGRLKFGFRGRKVSRLVGCSAVEQEEVLITCGGAVHQFPRPSY